jgi:hypothetical protein
MNTTQHDDEAILSKVQAYFDTLKFSRSDWWDALSDAELDLIQRGIDQLDNGERIPHDTVRGKAELLTVRK